jgi:dihydrofolate reductase
MKAIVCADINWGIGKGAGMLFHIPADLKFFKEKTMGGTVIMGRTTFLSLPGPKALPGRKNIVLTRSDGWSAENVTVCRSTDELADIININDDEKVFLIGGEAVYNELIDSCDEAYVTRVNADGNAEKFFPDLDRREGWRLVERSAAQESNGYIFTFDRYVKK